jgi:uncharacterized membrane protein YfhO
MVYLIPILFLLVLFSHFQITPFGNHSLVTSDFNNQYISYFAYFKHHFLDFKQLFGYSYAINLGGSFLGITTYYLLSPFNLLFLLFPVQQFPFVITLITVLKIATLGLTMYCYLVFYLRHTGNKYHGYDVYVMGLLAIMFALMGFVISYKSNIMWLDPLILLPIVMIGLEKVFNQQRTYLYIFSLMLTIILNYYIGFIICLFVGVFFLYRLLILAIAENESWYKLRSITIQFAISSIIAGALSAFVLLPSFKSVQNNGAAPFAFHMWQRFSPVKIVTGLYSGVVLNYLQTNLPTIFCGLLVVGLIFYYFVNTKILLKEKIISAVFLVFLVISQSTEGTYLIWHGFTEPNGFSNRNAFIFPFVLIYLAANAWIKHSDWKNSFILKSSLIYIVISLIVYTFSRQFLTVKLLLWNIVFFIAIISLLAMIQCKPKFIFLLLLGVFSIADIGQNAYQWQKMPRENLSVQQFNRFYSQTQPVINHLKNKDTSFYRIGTTFMRADTDPLLMNYNGLSNYNSADNLQNVHFLSHLGYFQNYSYWRWMNYNNGSTLGMDSLLGIKYVVANQSNTFNQTFDGAVSSMAARNTASLNISEYSKQKDNTFTIYKNKLAAGLVSLGNHQIITNQLNGNPFERQNQIFNALGNRGEALYQPNLVKKLSAHQYQIEVKNAGMVYLFLPVTNKAVTDFQSTAAIISINEKKAISYGNQAENGVVCLGQYSKGQRIDLKVTASSPENQKAFETLYQQQPVVYSENIARLKRDINRIKSKQPNTSISTNKIKFNVDNQQDNMALLSIPYDTGWHATINGHSVVLKKGFNNLLALPLEKGHQKIIIKFIPNGLKLGMIISLIGLMMLITYIILMEKRFNIRQRGI